MVKMFEAEAYVEEVSGLSQSELEVVLWRYDQFYKSMGFTDLDSAALALDFNIDLNEARKLIDNGCNPELAFDILT